ncbi:hypothetical protein BD626DRAFT_571395 [Schizophyllum amplum]|uniref:Uncharacterized protein n=1 Tax=Schizophyllum amplum TaxID=97359 RepID=A0A550C7A8_9AGAR|nr:hypothetical protein BD626DRAFT_571395 [Auriculariopsis ampla]
MGRACLSKTRLSQPGFPPTTASPPTQAARDGAPALSRQQSPHASSKHPRPVPHPHPRTRTQSRAPASTPGTPAPTRPASRPRRREPAAHTTQACASALLHPRPAALSSSLRRVHIRDKGTAAPARQVDRAPTRATSRHTCPPVPSPMASKGPPCAPAPHNSQAHAPLRTAPPRAPPHRAAHAPSLRRCSSPPASASAPVPPPRASAPTLPLPCPLHRRRQSHADTTRTRARLPARIRATGVSTAYPVPTAAPASPASAASTAPASVLPPARTLASRAPSPLAAIRAPRFSTRTPHLRAPPPRSASGPPHPMQFNPKPMRVSKPVQGCALTELTPSLCSPPHPHRHLHRSRAGVGLRLLAHKGRLLPPASLLGMESTSVLLPIYTYAPTYTPKPMYLHKPMYRYSNTMLQSYQAQHHQTFPWPSTMSHNLSIPDPPKWWPPAKSKAGRYLPGHYPVEAIYAFYRFKNASNKKDILLYCIMASTSHPSRLKS